MDALLSATGIDANGCEPRLTQSGDIDLASAGTHPLSKATIYRVAPGDAPFSGSPRPVPPTKNLATARGKGLMTWAVSSLEPGIYKAQTQIPLYSDNSAHAAKGFYFRIHKGGVVTLCDAFGIALK